MAQKRMFDKGLIETDEFMDMSMPTKALYFLLGMEADDEGFVSPKRVMRIYGGNDDDLKVLMAKKYVISFKSGVVVITHWNKNNWLDNRRIKETLYQAEKKLIGLSNGKYELLSGCLADAVAEESSIEENRIEESSKSCELSSQIKDIMSIFYKINPTLNWGNKTNRSSAEFMIKKFGFDGTKKMAEQITGAQGQPYCPVATTPYHMKEKLAQFKIYFESAKVNKNNLIKV